MTIGPLPMIRMDSRSSRRGMGIAIGPRRGGRRKGWLAAPLANRRIRRPGRPMPAIDSGPRPLLEPLSQEFRLQFAVDRHFADLGHEYEARHPGGPFLVQSHRVQKIFAPKRDVVALA